MVAARRVKVNNILRDINNIMDNHIKARFIS